MAAAIQDVFAVCLQSSRWSGCSRWDRAKLNHLNGYIKLKNRAWFWAYIVVFAVKKRIIHRNPWPERKDIIFRVTSGTPQLNRHRSLGGGRASVGKVQESEGHVSRGRRFNGVNKPQMPQKWIESFASRRACPARPVKCSPRLPRLPNGIYFVVIPSGWNAEHISLGWNLEAIPLVPFVFI